MHHRRLLDTEMTVPPPASGNRTHDAYVNEANFDTNMVIILAALLCALICALGLNSIVRCALRCSHRFSMETPAQAAARLAATGLKKTGSATNSGGGLRRRREYSGHGVSDLPGRVC
ncbi:RING-H2 finger protein [Melia azedarach]|uniref:RING-H2 finger protein n=1 Tax=Melia azedarach TaxID=155640 RepID=A0ACC1WYS8_MELAZ|nr:RING-H2 finger protein [Melia azedarach]